MFCIYYGKQCNMNETNTVYKNPYYEIYGGHNYIIREFQSNVKFSLGVFILLRNGKKAFVFLNPFINPFILRSF